MQKIVACVLLASVLAHVRSSSIPIPIRAAPLVGASGIVYPDGRLVQFTQSQADNIAVAGPSGIVSKDGKNTQFRLKRSAPLVGPSGILFPDGRQVQFTQSQVENIAVAGPSGIVSKDGKNTQFRLKRSLKQDLVGPSGILHADGTFTQFTNAQVANAVSFGPSGIVSSDGKNTQFRGKRSLKQDLVGPSGILHADGTFTQFTNAQVANAVSFGPSGIVSSDGKNTQFRGKRSLKQDLVGPSGILHADGTFTQFTNEQVANAVSFGPSGIVSRDGKNTQFRGKRSVNEYGDLVGASAIIFANGQLHQLSAPGVTIASRGESGAVLSDGQNVQFTHSRKKRAVNEFGDVVAPSAIIFANGQVHQLKEAGTTIASRGESGAVLSTGEQIQFTHSRKKRAVNEFGDLVAPSAIIFAHGQVHQLPAAGVTIASRGDAGAVLSNGQNVQFKL